MGGYGLVWSDEGGEEVREVDALDAPLVSRVAVLVVAGVVLRLPSPLGGATEVRPEGIRVQTGVLGRPLVERVIPAERIESLYVLPGAGSHELVVAGAEAARALVVEALVGPST